MDTSTITSNTALVAGTATPEEARKKLQEEAHKAFSHYKAARPCWWNPRSYWNFTCQQAGSFADSKCEEWQRRDLETDHVSAEPHAGEGETWATAILVVIGWYLSRVARGVENTPVTALGLFVIVGFFIVRAEYRRAVYAWNFHEKDRKARQVLGLQALAEHYVLDRELRWSLTWVDQANKLVLDLQELMRRVNRAGGVTYMGIDTQWAWFATTRAKDELAECLKQLSDSLMKRTQLLRTFIDAAAKPDDRSRVSTEPLRFHEALQSLIPEIEACDRKIHGLQNLMPPFRDMLAGLEEVTGLMTAIHGKLP